MKELEVVYANERFENDHSPISEKKNTMTSTPRRFKTTKNDFVNVWTLSGWNGRNGRNARSAKAMKNELGLEPEECPIHVKEGKPALTWSSGAALGRKWGERSLLKKG